MSNLHDTEHRNASGLRRLAVDLAIVAAGIALALPLILPFG